MPEPMTAPSPRDRLRAFAAHLAERPQVPWHVGEPDAAGVRPLPYPVYDPCVWPGLLAAQELAGGADHDYLEHHRAIATADPAGFSAEQLATCFTFHLRGERFCDGHIAGAIRSGRLAALVARLQDLLARGQTPGQGADEHLGWPHD